MPEAARGVMMVGCPCCRIASSSIFSLVVSMSSKVKELVELLMLTKALRYGSSCGRLSTTSPAGVKVIVLIEVYSNRVEISNPGEPIVPVERFIDGYQSRNERLAKSCAG